MVSTLKNRFLFKHILPVSTTIPPKTTHKKNSNNSCPIISHGDTGVGSIYLRLIDLYCWQTKTEIKKKKIEKSLTIVIGI
jgi:hypothetical protein